MKLREIEFVTISPKASNDPAHGHYYSVHKRFAEAMQGNGRISHIISARQGLDGLISFGLQAEYTRYFFSYPKYCARYFDRDIQLLSRFAAGAKRVHFHVYEGGLLELIQILRLIALFPHASATFNFFYANEWASLLNDSRTGAKKIVREIERASSLFSDKLFLTAETKKLALKIASTSTIRISEIYPVFSVYAKNSELSPDSHRQYTFLFAPQTISDLLSAVKFWKEYKKQFPSSKAAVVGRADLKITSQIEVTSLFGDDVIFKGNTLSEKDYKDLHLASKYVWLAYNHDHYRYGSSGRLLDAFAFGCVPIVRGDFSMADEIMKDKSGLVIDVSREFAETIQSLAFSEFSHPAKLFSEDDVVDMLSRHASQYLDFGDHSGVPSSWDHSKLAYSYSKYKSSNQALHDWAIETLSALKSSRKN